MTTAKDEYIAISSVAVNFIRIFLSKVILIVVE